MLALFLVAASLGMSNLAASIAIGVSGVDARTRLRVGLVFGAFEAGMPVLGLLIGDQAAASLGHEARWIGAGLLIAVGLYALASAARAGQAQEHSQPQPHEHAQVWGRVQAPEQAQVRGQAPGEVQAQAHEPAQPQPHEHSQVWGQGQVWVQTQAPGEAQAQEQAEAQDQAEGEPGRSGEGCSATDLAARGRDSTGQVRPPRLSHLLVSGLALSVDNLVVGFALGTYHTSIVLGVIVIGAVSVAMSLLGLQLGAGLGRWAGRRGEQLAGVMLIAVGIAIASGALS